MFAINGLITFLAHYNFKLWFIVIQYDFCHKNIYYTNHANPVENLWSVKYIWFSWCTCIWRRRSTCT